MNLGRLSNIGMKESRRFSLQLRAYNGVLLVAEKINADVGERERKIGYKGFTNDGIINIIVLAFVILGILAAGVISSGW